MKVKDILKSRGLSSQKRLSQCFLNSESIVDKIIQSADLYSEDVVIEIGTGLGILTNGLAKVVSRVISFEKDAALVESLPKEMKSDPKIEVICHDFMSYDLMTLRDLHKKIKIVANLPYHLSTEIMFKLFEHRDWIESMTLMFQKEVAERIVAKPNTKSYGTLSVLSQLYSDPKLSFHVPRSCFYPQPNVDSAVVHFMMKKDIHMTLSEENLFKKIVRAGFGQRRKMIKKSLEKILTKQQINMLKLDVATRRLESFGGQEIKDLVRHLI